MSMEYAGVVEVDPPVRGAALNDVYDAGWAPSRDGRRIRPHRDAGLEAVLQGIRELVAADEGRRCYAGVVAAYDPVSRDLMTITVREGRVVRRTLRRPTVRTGTNVIDLATHRRTFSRQIG
ncbi:MAG: hypothetical protein QM747_10090 [Nocardioides sp.]